ncbi:MAG: hypothetical protein QOE77_4279 [Blastocatellia bacterium]|nr:hypothetical protein [Blastocatellia bacterium]
MTRAARPLRPERPWSVPVRAAEVPQTGRHFNLVADETVRAAVAKLADVRALPHLEAAFDVAALGRDGLHVVGRVLARVGQVCGVTLEPIESQVDEAVDLVFSPSAKTDLIADDDKEVEVTADDAPELFTDGVVDLGALATEFLILGIDPYPRKPEAVFEPPLAADEAVRPFAALAAFKKGEGQR